MRGQNILIIGSNGFIGSACFNYFSMNNSVWGCDILGADNRKNYFQLKDRSDFGAMLSGRKFDLLINASGSSGVGFSIDNPEKDRELNTTNVETMLLAVKMWSPKTKFINFSSAAVYGNPKQLPIKESDPLLPLSPYGQHKLEAERILKRFHEKEGLDTCSLRVFSAYGPGLYKQLFWDIFLKTKKSKQITLYGTGKESRDFIFIDDLVRAIECIAQKAKMKGECINVASGVEVSIAECAKIFLDAVQQGFELNFSGEEKKGDPINWRADVSILNDLGFTAVIPLSEGLHRLAKAYKGISLPDGN